MGQNYSEKSLMKPVRKDMNHIGYATLARFLLGMVLSYGVYLIAWAAIGAPHILVWRGGVINLAATVARLRASVSHITLLYPLLLLFATVFVNLVPFTLCAKKLGMNTRGFFAKPAIGGGKTAIFGFVVIGVNVSASFVLNMIVMLLQLLKIRLSTPSFTIPLQSPLGTAAMVLAIVIVAPIAEEFMFRGVVLGTLKKYGSVFAVVCSSLLWALMHGNIIQAVPVFCIGILLGVLALKANSILPSIVLHMANNLIALFGMIAKQTGSVPLMIVLVGINLLIAITAIPLFCVYYNDFLIGGQPVGGSASGSRTGVWAFFTSWPILLTILIYTGFIVASVIPTALAW